MAKTELREEERASLARLLESETMTRAPRLCAVLRYLVDAFIEGRSNEITEQSIGEAVFGKPVGYNPGDDNIVRVTLRHLRTRLEEFYRTEGKHETYILEIPKGKYIPFLVPREAGHPGSGTPAAATPPRLLQALETDPAPPPSLSSRVGIGWLVAGALLVLSLALSYTLYRVEFGNAARAGSQESSGLLQMLVQHGNQLTVVVTDSNLQAYREIFKKEVSLDSYIDRSYVRSQPNAVDNLSAGALKYASGTTETTLTSAIVAATIQKAAAPVVVSIRHPHDLSLRDFQSGNMILLGGPWINPWGQLFEDRLNFQLVPPPDNPAGSVILNRHPQPGEPATFVPRQENGQTITYVRIAVLPNLNKSGQVVLVGANSLESLEAGGDYLISQDFLNDLLRRFQVSSLAQLPSFEVVLEVKGINAVPGNIRVVAQRAITPSS